MSNFKLLLTIAGIINTCLNLFASNTAVRDLPDNYTPGGTVNVSISVTVYQESPVTGLIITETLPQGWAITSSNPSWAKYIADTNSYKWLYFFQFPVYGTFTITYTARVPSDSSGACSFAGTINDGYSTRDITGDTIINQLGQVSVPVFTPAPQTFYNFFPDVEISCSTVGSTVYFTTDGSEPDLTSTVYTSPIHITGTTTIKAKAYKEGFSPSRTETGVFEIQIQKADINRDTVIDISDVILCLRMAINLDITVDGIQYSSPYRDWLTVVADINNDGVIDISDVILSLRIAIGLS